ncbi:MAG: tol-pal system protein YbgF [Gammaproteobacteria bacterium]|nr:MAG: tol-pal system protein YbgF [Gammaproteobacteria bacterium]
MRASPVSRRIRSRPRNAWMRCRRGCGSYAGASRSSSTTTRPWRSSSGTSTRISRSVSRRRVPRARRPLERPGTERPQPARRPATGAGGAGAAAPSAASSTEQAVYAQAFDALKAGSYSVAITGFKDFLASYPSSPLAENAQYWLGEAYYVNHDYESAAGAFRAVLKKWPDSRKAPDALLKLGYTQYAQKQYPAARATLTEVLRKYPGSDSAKHAAERLRRFSGAGSQ